MPKQATRELYTDKSPTGIEAGIVTTDPGAGFTLVGKGNIISDADIERYGLQDSPYLVDWSAEKARADNEAKNKATYETNAAKHGGAFVGHQAAAVATQTEKYVEPPVNPDPPEVPVQPSPLVAKYGESNAELLAENGFDTVEKVEAASDEDLLAINGIGKVKLDQIRAS